MLIAFLAFVVNRVAGRKYGSAIMRVVQWRDTVRSVVVGVSMATVGFLIARAHLHVFDPWFLRYGKVAGPAPAVRSR